MIDRRQPGEGQTLRWQWLCSYHLGGKLCFPQQHFMCHGARLPIHLMFDFHKQNPRRNSCRSRNCLALLNQNMQVEKVVLRMLCLAKMTFVLTMEGKRSTSLTTTMFMFETLVETYDKKFYIKLFCLLTLSSKTVTFPKQQVLCVPRRYFLY